MVVPPERRRPGRREDILRTFTRHVAQHGYAGANLGDIASELGLSKGTIVHHFGTKEQLLAELHEQYMLRRIAEAERIIDHFDDPSERMAGLIASFTYYQEIDRDATVAFQREVNISRTSTRMSAARDLRSRYRSLVIGVLEDGIRQGVFRSGDARLWTLYLFGSSHWMWTWHSVDGRVPLDTIASSFVDLALGSLLEDRATLPRLTDTRGLIFTAVRSILGRDS